MKNEKEEKIHIAITCSWRFECLNVLLDILKLNSKSNIITHVFCNLNNETFERFKSEINHDNVDFFHHLPDLNCNMNVNHKIETRRRQPLDFFINVMSHMSLKKEVEKFIYTECDVFPLEINAYLSHLLKINEKIFCGGKIINKDLTSSKTPSGYLCMSPLYFYNNHKKIQDLIYDLKKNKTKYLQRNYAFEGMVCESFKNINCDVFPVSKYFISNYQYEMNLDPITVSTHQHNPLYLKRSFEKYSIRNGRFVHEVLSSEKLIQSYNKEVLTIDGFNNKIIEFQKEILE